MKRVGFAVLVMALAAFGSARPEYLDLVKKVYLVQPGSKIATAGCALCHTQVPKRNVFGEAVGEALKASGTKALTTQLLQQASNPDSDGDGVRNEDELKADTLPGVADKKVAPVEAPKPSLWPSHSFHPLLTHFPIALFLFGAFLEAFGAWKKDSGLRRAAVWNMAFGSLVAIPSVITGLLARNLTGMGDAANIHLYLTLAATLVMIAVTLWRRKAELNSVAYWATLGLASALICAGGHFGALLVHG